MKKVLVVDDRQEGRYLLEVILKGKGYEVVSAENGADALEKLRENPVDMIISDILMPVMDGYQLCRVCKSDAGLRKIPFIFYSASYTDKKDEEFALSLGADRFIVKPADPEVLLEILEGLIKEGAAGSYVASKEHVPREEAYFKAYSGVLIRKPEDKMLKLEEEVAERKRKEVALRKINRAYKMLSTCNQLLIRVNEEKELLQGVCRIIVTEGGYKLAWVGFAEQDEVKTVRPVAQAGYEEGYLDTVSISWADTDLGHGPTGTAIRKGKPIVNKNILTDPDFEPWRAEAAKRGYASSIALPLIIEKQALGALNIYAAEPDAFDSDEKDLLMELADDLAYGVRALRLQAERARAEEEVDRLAKFPSEDPNPVLRISKEGTIIYANEASSLLLSAWQSEVNQPLPDEWLDFNRKVLRSGKVKNTECECPGKTYSLTFAPVVNAGYTNLYGLDITEGKKAEQILRESEERYRSLTQTATDAIISINSRGDIESWNRGAQEMFGYTEVEILNKPMTLCIPERYREAHRKGMERLLATGEPHIIGKTVELYGLNKNGDEFPMELSLSSWETGHGKYFTGIIRDISERMKADEEMRKLSHAVEQSPSAVIITDIEGSIEYVNPRFTQMSGYSAAEVVGKKPDIFRSGELSSEVFREMEETITSGEEWRGEFHNKKKNGELYWVSSSVSAIMDLEGEITHFLAVQEDISEKKLLEKQLRQAQKMEAIGALAGGIAHDFNNILFPIIGYAEMLLEDSPVDSPNREALNEIFNSANRAREPVKQILTFSRQTEQELRPLKAQIIIKEVLKLIKATLPSTIEINQNIDNNCGMVLADPTQIHQIAMNLITNAYHAMEDTGGELTVSLKEVDLEPEEIKDSMMRGGAYICLKVSDTGTGMDQTIMERIFDPYFTTKAKERGTGLGLAVVHGIVNSYGGDIKVTSDVGKGTAFRVYLPRIETKSVFEETEAQDSLRGGEERILVVDDELSVVKTIKNMLERLGYDITSKTSSVEALEMFRSDPHSFDVVITDMTMPKMTGVQLSKNLMEIRADIPIILCTGFSEKINEERARELGISGYLMKPVVKREMAEMIRKVLDED